MALKTLCSAMKRNLANNFNGYLTPIPPDQPLGGNWCGWLDYAETDDDDGMGGKMTLIEYDWFEEFPTDLQLCHYKATYELLDVIRIETAEAGITL